MCHGGGAGVPGGGGGGRKGLWPPSTQTYRDIFEISLCHRGVERFSGVIKGFRDIFVSSGVQRCLAVGEGCISLCCRGGDRFPGGEGSIHFTA